jgi:hypothetical protein
VDSVALSGVMVCSILAESILVSCNEWNILFVTVHSYLQYDLRYALSSSHRKLLKPCFNSSAAPTIDTRISTRLDRRLSISIELGVLFNGNSHSSFIHLHYIPSFGRCIEKFSSIQGRTFILFPSH